MITSPNRAPSFLAVMWVIPLSASSLRCAERDIPSSLYSLGASTLTSEKSKFRLAKAMVLSTVPETAAAVNLPNDIVV